MKIITSAEVDISTLIGGGNNFKSLHYVNESNVSFFAMGTDPIMKEYKVLVNGNSYHGFQFLKGASQEHKERSLR